MDSRRGRSSPPRQLTAGTAADSGPRWAPDSASLFFLSDRTGSVQLHRIRVDGGEAEGLTDWHGEIYDACPLADGRVAVVAADGPSEEDQRRRAERDDAMVWSEQPGCGRLRWLDPVSFASKIRTPVLIVHGEDDANVPLGQAIYFHRALSQYGAEHELVIYPREGHGLAERNHQRDLLLRTRAWFDRWLGGS